MNDNEPKNNQDEIKDDGEVMQKAYEFTPKGPCQYRQRGPYLICMSCEVQHATYIGMDMVMVGEDTEGNPILKKRSEYFNR